jgi:hypothetical protein
MGTEHEETPGRNPGPGDLLIGRVGEGTASSHPTRMALFQTEIIDFRYKASAFGRNFGDRAWWKCGTRHGIRHQLATRK